MILIHFDFCGMAAVRFRRSQRSSNNIYFFYTVWCFYTFIDIKNSKALSSKIPKTNNKPTELNIQTQNGVLLVCNYLRWKSHVLHFMSKSLVSFVFYMDEKVKCHCLNNLAFVRKTCREQQRFYNIFLRLSLRQQTSQQHNEFICMIWDKLCDSWYMGNK